MFFSPVPLPSAVRAEERWGAIRARSGGPTPRPLASRPILHAPAGGDYCGPTITGPMMSSSETILYPAVWRDGRAGRERR